ncbi:C1 family peptidase [Polyangium spumosum]|uniref:Peptidase C1A papain C-terminal domain-containing protein n=1 Tax=Polyangium spumosum TaxID=889282 RepID=A0A6N7Q700_9BACT|nr:C1 family peptidase [Polyangium spumosum]MRG98495.1 hypothetical protein [Polyangium spumosum]
MQKTALATGSLLLGLVIWSAACDNPDCSKDTDCKGNRLCIDGACTDDTETPNPSGGSGGSPGSTRCRDIGGGQVICLQESNPGPSEGEILLGTVPAPPGPLPASASLKLDGFTVPNQGSCGSCAAFATRSAMGIRAVTQASEFVDFSPAHIWHIAGYGSDDCIQGSSIHHIFYENQEAGAHVVPASTWLYDPWNPESSLDAVPSADVLLSAGVAYIGEFVTVSPKSVNELKYAIVQGWAPVIGVPVFWDDWEDFDVSGEGAAGEPDSNHAITVVSYDDAAQRFTFVNSWGTGWGNSGTATMSYEFVAQYSMGGTAVQNLTYKGVGGCGDGVCGNGETQSSCCKDCGCPTGAGCQGGICVPGSSCGDGTAAPEEACDGNDFKGKTCGSLGYQSGTLSCHADCSLNTSGCCNNECVAGATQCANSDAQQTCGNYDADTCMEWGALTTCPCVGNACATQQCNNGVKEGSEVCDGFDLGGATCQGQGYDNGTLACNGTCTGYSSSGCCSNQCTPGTTTCSNGVVQSCGNYDPDACYELATIDTCKNGQICIGPGCGCPSGNSGRFEVVDYVYPNFGPVGCSGDGTLKLKASAAMIQPTVLRVYVRKADDSSFSTPGTLTLYVGTGPTCPNPPNVIKTSVPIVTGSTEQKIDLTVDPYGAAWALNETKQFWVGKDEGGFQSWRATNTVSVKRKCIP